MELTLLPPLLVLLFAVTLGGTWVGTNGRFRHLALLGFGFGVVGIAMVVQFYRLPPLFSASLYAGGAMIISYGLLVRSGAVDIPPALLALATIVVLGTAVFSYVEDSVLARVYVVNFGLGAIFLYPLWRDRRLVRGTPADRIVFWSLLVTGLHFFPRTLLTSHSITSADAIGFTGSIFWIAIIYSSAILTVMLGINVILATALDVIATLQNDRDTDPLTGLYNRRGLDLKLTQLTSDPAYRPVSLIMCDIDHFKSVNDRFGHPAGDLVLKAFAQTLRDHVRPTDPVARIGGEEFVIIVQGASLADAAGVAERLRRAMAEADLSQAGLSLTASFGVVEMRPDEGSWAAMHRADELLYLAKRNGRNRTEATAAADPSVVEPGTTAAEAELHRTWIRQVEAPSGDTPPDPPPTIH